MHVNNSGGEPTIVFLHGANAGAWMWNPVLDHMPDVHSLCPDLPGHGRSATEDWTTLEEIADDLATLLRDRCARGRAHIVGLSLGAYLGLVLIDRHPEVVESAFLSGVPSKPLPNPRLMRTLGYLMVPFIHTKALLQMNARALRIPESQMIDYVTRSRENSRQAFLKINAQAIGFTAPNRALQTPVRKLFVAGSREHPLIRTSLADFLNRSERVECYEVENAGHAWSSEHSELFAAAVDAWTTGQELPPQLVPISAA